MFRNIFELVLQAAVVSIFLLLAKVRVDNVLDCNDLNYLEKTETQLLSEKEIHIYILRLRKHKLNLKIFFADFLIFFKALSDFDLLMAERG